MTRAAILLITLWAASILFPCSVDVGPFFSPQRIPENPTSFQQGRLGLLTPTLTKENELLAYRLLSGLKVEENKEQAKQENAANGATSPDWRQTWIAARASVPVLPAAPQFIDSYRSHSGATPFVYYRNCLDDAFQTAARTLQDRRQKYPSPSIWAEWVIAQDQVFTNCSSNTPQFPESAAANASALVRADREYQIAAAYFYAEDLQVAEQRFRAIAADRNSPWQHTGSYMIARTLLRQAALKNDASARPRARQQFEKIASDSSAGNLARSARGLLQHLDALDRPGALMQLLTTQLLLPRPPREAFADTVQQSVYILEAESFKTALAEPDLPDAFDWVKTFEADPSGHAPERWRATHSLPWLTTSLMYASGKDKSAAELIEQADRLDSNSPAFGTAKYNAIRLRMERGEKDQPRRQLNALLAASKQQPDSLVNGWRAERMRLANSFDDLLRWGPRKPIGAADYSSDEKQGSPVLDRDAANVLNYSTPLAKLTVAAHSAKLPPWSASDVALATWTRAYMLNDAAGAADAAPLVAKAHPGWPGLSPGSGGRADEWRFRSALLIALHREFQPLVPVDYRKHFGSRAWWCPVTPPSAASPDTQNMTVAWRLPAFFKPPEAAISRQERGTAEAEVDRLRKMGSAQSFLAPIIFDWAKTHPDDPLVPQALHRLVVVVRHGCHSNDGTDGRISKTAFDLLHERYSKSEWAAQTPYWFQ